MSRERTLAALVKSRVLVNVKVVYARLCRVRRKQKQALRTRNMPINNAKQDILVLCLDTLLVVAQAVGGNLLVIALKSSEILPS